MTYEQAKAITEAKEFNGDFLSLLETPMTTEEIEAHEVIAQHEERVRKAELAGTEFAIYEEPKVCPRCSGRGRMEEYHHVSGGICFKCDGSGLAH